MNFGIITLVKRECPSLLGLFHLQLRGSFWAGQLKPHDPCCSNSSSVSGFKDIPVDSYNYLIQRGFSVNFMKKILVNANVNGKNKGIKG